MPRDEYRGLGARPPLAPTELRLELWRRTFGAAVTRIGLPLSLILTSRAAGLFFEDFCEEQREVLRPWPFFCLLRLLLESALITADSTMMLVDELAGTLSTLR